MKFYYKWQLKRLQLKEIYLRADKSLCPHFLCEKNECRTAELAVIMLKIKFIEERLKNEKN